MAGARGRYEEAIRLYVETSGDKELGQLARVLGQLGEGADESAGQAQELVAELEKLAGIGNNIRQFTGMKAALADTGDALEKAQREAADLRREFEQAEAPTKRLQRAMERADASVEKLTRQQNRQQAELGRSRLALRAAGVDTENLADAYAELQGRMGGIGERARVAADAMDRVGADTKKAATGLSLMERASRGASSSLATIGARLTAVSAAATAALGAMAAAGTAALFTGAIRSAATLEDALSQVRAVSGATAEEMEALRAAAEAGGAATRFSTLEAAQGLGELARATGSATQAIGALPATLSLAQASGIGVAEAALLMTTTLTQFGLSADQAGRVADVMAKEVNSTTDSMGLLGNALTYSAPLAKQLGLDLEQTAAIIGVLADQGFRGERAGTALRNVFTELSDPASDFSAALRGLGIESTNFVDIIDQLAAQSDNGRDALLNLDAAARPAITALVEGGSAQLARLEANLRAASGEAQRTAEIMGDNVPGALESISDAFDRTRRSLVDPMLEPLKDELVDLSKDLEEFAKSQEFEAISEALKTLFVEGAKEARAFAEAVDFQALAKSISDFATDADGSLTQFKNTVGEIADAVQVIGDTTTVVFNTVQTVVFAVAAAVTGVVSDIAAAVDTLSGPQRKVLEFLGILEGGPTALGEFAGGMQAVSDEFGRRMASNASELADAVDTFGEGVGAAASHSAAALDTAAESSTRLAEASTEVAAAADDATAALEGEAKGAAQAAAATDSAAAKMESDAARLRKAFADMGIASQRELERAAEAARRSFELIRNAVGSGEASAEDARRAFAAYADAARTAVAESDNATKKRVEAELRVQAAVTGVTKAFGTMGEAGAASNDAISQSAGRAASAMGDMASAARSTATSAEAAAENTEQAGDEAEASGKKMEGAAEAGQAFALSLFQISEKAAAAYSATNRYAASPLWNDMVNRVTAQVNEQGKALQQQVKDLQAANAAFDELAQRREELSSRFDLLGAAEIEKLVQAEALLERNREQAAQKRAREAEKRQTGTDEQVKIAQRDATDAAVAVTDMVARTKEAAAALSSAATTVRGAVGEVVVRFINDPSNAQPIVISDGQMRQIATEVFRLVRQSKGAST